MHATRNLKNSPVSDRLAPVLVFAALAALGSLAAWYCFLNRWTLYYGDAEAHLEIARRIVDSRTPGYEQIGTVWLPLPHVLMLPFVQNTFLWQTGLAGAIPGVICFATAGTFLFAAAKLLFGSRPAAASAAALLALNPNLLYLQATPMNEVVMLACLAGLMYFTVRFAATPRSGFAAAAGLCSAAASMTRYDGWFLIPFVCAYLFLTGGERRWSGTLVFACVAGMAPAYWLLHNQYFYSNALEFYNGPYSPRAIYARGHMDGSHYPGEESWSTAVRYYASAAWFCAGTALVCIGIAGAIAAVRKQVWWPLFLLSFIPVFYILGMRGSGVEIFVPNLWPFSYYNSRYGTAVLPLLALCGGALPTLFAAKYRKRVALLVIGCAVLPWMLHPRPDNWVTWKESKVNSDARREWTARGAEYLGARYRKGAGIFMSFSDLTGVLREAGIPLREALHEGNGPEALAAETRPDLFLWQEWALAIESDSVSSAMMKAVDQGLPYRLVNTIQVQGGPVIEFYRRIHDDPLYQGARRP